MRGGEGRGEGRWEKWEVEHGLWAKGLRWGMVCRVREDLSLGVEARLRPQNATGLSGWRL